jgi:hypothetical protein
MPPNRATAAPPSDRAKTASERDGWSSVERRFMSVDGAGLRRCLDTSVETVMTGIT